jgi:hypothetical protein
MEKFYRRSGDDPWVNSLVPNDSNPAKFGHLNTIVDAVTALQELVNAEQDIRFTFDEFIDYFGGIIIYGLPIFPEPQPGYTYSIVASDYTLENIFIYGEITDPNAKTTGFIPEPFYDFDPLTNAVTLKILTGYPAQFSSYTTHLEDPEYAQPGIYLGTFRLNLFRDAALYKTTLVYYTMDLQPILE